MRRIQLLLLLCLLAGTVYWCLGSFPGADSNNQPAAAPLAGGNWTELGRGALRLLYNDTAGRQAYFLRLDTEPVWEAYKLDYGSLTSGPEALRPVAVRTHDLIVRNPVPAFGVNEDILPLRSFATTGGRHYYLEEDGRPRDLAVSPDGGSIALTDRGHNAVWLWSPGANEPVQATSDRTPGYDKQAILLAGKTKEVEGWSLNWAERPCWSPDGRSVYYLSTRTSGGASRGTALWVLERESGREELACSRSNTFLDIIGWAGSQLLLSGGDGSILSYDPASRQTTNLLGNSQLVSLAPDGNRLLYQKLDQTTASLASPQLYAVTLNDGTTGSLPVLPAGYRFNDTGAWSPTGRRFAFLAYKTGAPWESILAILTFPPSRPPAITCYGPPAAAFDRSLPPAWIDENRLICMTDDPAAVLKAPVIWLLETERGDNHAD